MSHDSKAEAIELRYNELTLEEYVSNSIHKGELPSTIYKSLKDVGLQYGLDRIFATKVADMFLSSFNEWTKILNTEHIICACLCGGKISVISKMKYLSASTVRTIIKEYREDPFEIRPKYFTDMDTRTAILFKLYMRYFYREHEEYDYVKA